MRRAIVLLVIPLRWPVLTPYCEAQAKDRGKMTLPERVEVSGQSILLSALLPPEAPEALRSEANQISFGPSPLPGSVRVLGGKR